MLSKCGGPGSGVPGPCPKPDSESPAGDDLEGEAGAEKAAASLSSDAQTIDRVLNEDADEVDEDNADEKADEIDQYIDEMLDDAKSYYTDAAKEMVDEVYEDRVPADEDHVEAFDEAFAKAEKDFKVDVGWANAAIVNGYEKVGANFRAFAEAIRDGKDATSHSEKVSNTQSILDKAAEDADASYTRAQQRFMAAVNEI